MSQTLGNGAFLVDDIVDSFEDEGGVIVVLAHSEEQG
jgi:hypothetical protein